MTEPIMTLVVELWSGDLKIAELGSQGLQVRDGDQCIVKVNVSEEAFLSMVKVE